MAEAELEQRFLARLLDFVQGAAELSGAKFDGWLPASCLLLGTAAELVAKRQLLKRGIAYDALKKRKPYGHDLDSLWREHTDLWEEASMIAQSLVDAGDLEQGFSFALQFEKLAHLYGSASDYALRYPDGCRTFADPRALSLILGEIVRRERMR